MGQFSNSFPKHFSYLCEYAFRFDLSCSFCEYPIIFHCLHCSPSCFDPDSLLLAYLWLGLSWIDSFSAIKRFSSPKTSSRKPYTSNEQQERPEHSAETTINFSYPAWVLSAVRRGKQRQFVCWIQVRTTEGKVKLAKCLIDNGSEVNLVRRGFLQEDEATMSSTPVQLEGVSGHRLEGGDREAELAVRLVKQSVWSV